MLTTIRPILFFVSIRKKKFLMIIGMRNNNGKLFWNSLPGRRLENRRITGRSAAFENFYFDKFCQIKMPSWTKGRVALVGDAGYCASPAAGMGASLGMDGAAALADALQKHDGNFEPAFQDYNQNLRPFIEEVQATAEFNVKENFIPRTEEAIRKRNTETEAF
jgi:2-polyprenyl-6-methoxyphenol hydroxylase-like FAD-dependent oxidoreductase